MLDRQSTAVLNIINNISDGSYKIIDAEDIISKLSESDKASKLELSGIIRSLTDHELIKVKYSTLEEYCLAALPKARLVEEKVKTIAPVEEEAEDSLPIVATRQASDYNKIKKLVKWAAFYGALIGGAIVGVVGIVIGFIIR